MYDTYRGLTKILWGLLFVLIDINIEYVDIIPDFVGYSMIAYGLMQLDFEKERSWAVGIAIISFPTFFIPKANAADPMSYNGDYFFNALYYTGLGVLHLILMYLIISRLIKVAESKGQFEVAQQARTRLTMYVGVSIFVLVGFMVGEVLGFLLIIALIFSIIMEIVLLVQIAQFRRVL
ncbi:hypothetical protein B4U37_13905 [Sutcliffiella horikoshii]|uniref:Uncharacterized protein n=1 Tax=Sutcliffiella horikoshii TaxID=79883 RepID=A0ABN4ZJH7_9BACI|nr:hypothetical protein [Sutcliffiella horikoshii]ART77076.1 hypothetical protein B4U37_13905 [Sutcliffiella horikoshii]